MLTESQICELVRKAHQKLWPAPTAEYLRRQEIDDLRRHVVANTAWLTAAEADVPQDVQYCVDLRRLIAQQTARLEELSGEK